MQVELLGIRKSFGRSRALWDFNLSIPPASVIAMVGENGVGKSTLLRIMAGISVPDEGLLKYDSVIFDRENMELRKRLHFIPDMPLLFPDVTVARNISTLAALYGKNFQGREEYFSEQLQETGCAPLMKRTAGSLSRGQMWKVGLGCVAAITPDLLLADEPFASGMDEIGMDSFRRIARNLVAGGSTVVYTTQMISMAVDFSDYVCVIRGGSQAMLAESATLLEYLDREPEGAKHLLQGTHPSL